jgi:hypothetical protein
MDSAFSSTAIKEHLPLFRQTVQQVYLRHYYLNMPDPSIRPQTVSAWKDIVTEGRSPSTELDVVPWMYRTTLDILGASERPFTSI